MNAVRLLASYRWFYCLLVIIASIQTLLAEASGDRHVVPLAGAEILGALLLLPRRTQYLGLALLLMVFGLAQLLAALAAAWPTRFLQYAGAALLIVLLDRALRAPHAVPPVARAPAVTAS